MNQLQPFNYEGQDVRTTISSGELWWALKDVCDVLDIANNRNVATRLDDDEKHVHSVDTLGGKQDLIFISESGLYNVILRSDKPQAKAFKRWVTHEVLPSIRQTGGYNLPKTLPDALRLAADLAEENQRLLPKAEMHDLFLSAENAQPMNLVAKSIGVGRNKLFQQLRDNDILMQNNTPFQRYIDRGYFEVIERPVSMGGQVINKTQTLVTAKGMDYIARIVNSKLKGVM